MHATKNDMHGGVWVLVFFSAQHQPEAFPVQTVRATHLNSGESMHKSLKRVDKSFPKIVHRISTTEWARAESPRPGATVATM